MYKRISDNVLGSIMIEEENKFIWNLINSPEFNRLSRISQLGLATYLYPTATHTRKAHSLGCYELARRSLNIIPNTLTTLQKKAFLAACLLHDLGHGPMSHIFESVHHIKHEIYTIEIIRNSNSQIYKILYLENPKLIDEVCLIITKKHKIKWLNELLSGSFDLDRMDYLMRDSLMTDVKYGLVNPEFILSQIEIIKDELVFSKNSISFLEDFIYGRHHMFINVYQHKKNCAFQQMYFLFFNRIDFLIKQKFNFEIDIKIFREILSKKIINLNTFLTLDDSFIWFYLKHFINSSDEILKKISSNLVNGILPEILPIEKIRKLPQEKEKNMSWAIISLKTDFKSDDSGILRIYDSSNKLQKYTKVLDFLNISFKIKKDQKFLLKI